MSEQTIPVSCPTCGSKARVPTSLVGQAVRCTNCGETLRVVKRQPAPQPAAPPPAPPATNAVKEPEAYRQLESAAASVFSAVVYFTCLGLVGCVVLGVMATGPGGPGAAGVGVAAVVACEFLFVLLIVVVLDKLVKVFVDAARGVRAIRMSVETKAAGEGR